MTPSRQPQQEYIITDEILESWNDVSPGHYIVKRIKQHARPHTSPPASAQRVVEHCKGKFDPKTEPCYQCPAIEVCPVEQDEIDKREHDAQVAKAERGRVLKVFEDHIASKQMISSGCTEHRCWLWSDGLETLIESLRAQPEPQQEGRLR